MSDYFDRVERQIGRRVQDGVPRSTRPPITPGHVATAAAVLVVLAVAGVFLLAGGRNGENGAPAAAANVRVVLTAATGAAPGAIERSAQLLRARLRTVVPGATVSAGGGHVVVAAPNAAAGARSQILALAAPGRMVFFDWEAEVLAPNGKTVAGQLPSPDPAVLEISQGNGAAAAGELGSGCMSLQQARALAARLGAGRARRTEYLGRLRLGVPVGYTVLQAAGPGSGRPSDGYFVVRDHAALSGSEVVNPKASTSPNTGIPDVEFSFMAAGRRAFRAVTAAVARRGARVSSLGQTLNQHFAVALDNQLITVPQIDYKQYPDGINGERGADISGSLSTRSAKDLAILLRYGPLPVELTATG